MTFNEARSLILGVFKDAWDITGYPAVYSDVAAILPDANETWARAVLRHAEGGQASLGGEFGSKRWRRSGTLFVQIFSPIGDALVTGYNNAQIIVNAFQKSNHPEIWFRDVRINEVGSDGAFQQINVLVTFFYDDIG
jgi:hypothetical protein